MAPLPVPKSRSLKGFEPYKDNTFSTSTIFFAETYKFQKYNLSEKYLKTKPATFSLIRKWSQVYFFMLYFSNE